jgi:hypothetical protein
MLLYRQKLRTLLGEQPPMLWPLKIINFGEIWKLQAYVIFVVWRRNQWRMHFLGATMLVCYGT